MGKRLQDSCYSSDLQSFSARRIWPIRWEEVHIGRPIFICSYFYPWIRRRTRNLSYLFYGLAPCIEYKFTASKGINGVCFRFTLTYLPSGR